MEPTERNVIMAASGNVEDIVIQILRLVQTDKDLENTLFYESGEEIDAALKKSGISANNNEIKLAIQIMGFIEEYKQSWEKSASRKYAEAEDEKERELRLGLRKGLIDGLLKVVTEIDKGYSRVMMMYLTAFSLGVFLVLISVGASLYWRENASVYLFGGLGLLGIISLLVYRAINGLQKSRSKLAQLQALFIGWLNDSYSWNRYWEAVINSSIKQTNQPPSFDEVLAISKIQLDNTQIMMKLIQQYSTPGVEETYTPSTNSSEIATQIGLTKKNKNNSPVTHNRADSQ